MPSPAGASGTAALARSVVDDGPSQLISLELAVSEVDRHRQSGRMPRIDAPRVKSSSRAMPTEARPLSSITWNRTSDDVNSMTRLGCRVAATVCWQVSRTLTRVPVSVLFSAAGGSAGNGSLYSSRCDSSCSSFPTQRSAGQLRTTVTRLPICRKARRA